MSLPHGISKESINALETSSESEVQWQLSMHGPHVGFSWTAVDEIGRSYVS